MIKAVGTALALLGTREKKRFVQIVLLVAIFIGAIVLAALSYRAIDQDLSAAALSRRDSIAYLAAATLTEKLDRLIDIGVSLATRVRFRQLIDDRRWSEAVEILQSVPRDFPFIDRLVVLDPTGTLMADVPAAPAVRGMNFSDRDWYKGVSQKWEPYVSDVYTRTAPPQYNVISVAIPIKTDDGRVAGLLVLQVKIETFFAWINQVQFGERGVVYVVDRRGNVASRPALSSPGNLLNLAAAPAVQKVLRGKRGIETLADPAAREERVVAYAPIAKYGWGVIAEQPKSFAFAAKDDLLAGVIGAYTLILLLFAGVTYLVSRVIVERRQSEVVQRANEQLEQRVAERTAQLQDVNKQLESFSYSISHDLRTPLRVIDGFARLLEEDHRDKLDAEGTRRLAIIRSNAAHMAQLIEDLLEFSRTGRKAIAASSIDMAALARQVADELQSASSKQDIGLTLNNMPPARGDPALIHQVWTNLLSNAIKFTGKKTDPLIEIGGYLEGREAVYYVKDNGAGFDMAHYRKLFGVFQRLHSARDFSGTGVGLAIVQRVVERHGGRVWATGKSGEGATFYFALPSASR